MSALMQAVLQRRWRQAKLLLDSGCNVNGRGRNGRTPLMELCFVDNEDKAAGLARVLLEKGANLDLRDNRGRTALSSACLFHKTKLFALFMKSVDFDLNASDHEGNTALFHAVSAGDVYVVKELVAKMLHYGLKVDVLNRKGDTPLIYALKLKMREIAEVLIRQGKASLEARDLEFQKSASEWRDELNKKREKFHIPSGYLRASGIQKTRKSVRRKLNKKFTKTGSARVELEPRVVLPRISKVRPVTAPHRIIVPSFFKPCTPVKKNLDKLYMIYNQQTTGSYRAGYKTIRYKEPIREETIDEINASESRLSSGRAGVSFNQVNELSIKLQGLYKNSAHKRKAMVSANPGLPRIDSDNSITVRSSSMASGKGCKIIKNVTKTMRQFDSSNYARELSSAGVFDSPKC